MKVRYYAVIAYEKKNDQNKCSTFSFGQKIDKL